MTTRLAVAAYAAWVAEQDRGAFSQTEAPVESSLMSVRFSR